MYGNETCGAGALVGYKQEQDPMINMTCGQNLERKIAEQKKRLADLEAALDEMKSTGLYNIKIGTLRDTMSY